MKMVFFEDGCIMTGRACNIRRAIEQKMRYDAPMRYWFRPTDEWRRATVRYHLIY